jgi:formylglycine-generating enzyme required for sulfatase activity
LFKSFVDLSFSNLLRPELLATGPVDTALLEAGLSDLAFQMQAKGESAAFTREQVGGYLSEDLLYAAQSANLLTLGEEIRFTHQLLQEYFAANRLKRELEKQTPAANFFPPDAWWKPTGWEETALLLAGLYNDDCSPVVDWLADAQPQLAVRCMFESGAALAENATEALRLRERWLPRLRDLARDSDAWARAAVGRALGQIDYDKIVNQRPRPLLDNRRGVGVVDGLPDIDWVTIPGGEFIYGEGQTGEKLFLPAFSIARYPITYVQFQCFAADPAVYGDPRWWEGLAADEDDKRLRDQGFKYANHPRESVNWYQAIAFCRWLSFQLWAVGTRHVVSAADYDPMNPLTWLVRLPTEQEWEKAARGPTGLIYPYGNTFDAQKGNSSETGIGMTSAVGVFPGGASPYGVEEMSGNIWEWCLNTPRGSINIDGTDVRCWRGGSWGLYTRGVRAASRYGNAPHGRDYGRGWRCVAAIFIPL